MPVITVSRMYGSSGSEIAERVAKALGWQFLDNDLIDAVAERAGLTKEEVAAREERVPSIVERLAEALALGSQEVLPPPSMASTDEHLVDMTRLVIEEAMQSGPTVFVGRGAQSLLANRDDALHVFCYAPKIALRRWVMQKFEISAEEADRRVADTNKHREMYVKRHWQRNWLAPDNYHLWLNTSWLGLDEAAQIVVETAHRHFEVD
ncbi:MAG TPA: cytidylate kinase-like family protein [Gemmatimonadaceae bacterium]|jgi:cytidylate kinase